MFGLFRKQSLSLKDVLVDSSEAHKMTTEAKEAALVPIYSQIKEAAKQGKAEVFLSLNRVPDEVKRHLQDHGYVVKISCGIKDGTTIEWDKWEYSN